MKDSSSGPGPVDQPGGWQPTPHVGSPPSSGFPRPPDQRPGTVTAAAIVTLVTSGIVAVVSVLGLLAFGAAREQMERQLRSQPELGQAGLDIGDVYGVVLGVLVVLVVWSLLACLLGVLLLRRSGVGRVLLVVSATMTALLSLLGIGSLVSAVPLFAAVAVIVLVFVGGANEWFAGTAAQPPGWRYEQSYGQAYGQVAGPGYGQPYGSYGQPPAYPEPSSQQHTQPYTREQPPWGKPADGGR